VIPTRNLDLQSRMAEHLENDSVMEEGIKPRRHAFIDVGEVKEDRRDTIRWGRGNSVMSRRWKNV
jgi:hypothetical protein